MAQETGSVGKYSWYRKPGQAARFDDGRLLLAAMPVQMPPGEANGRVQFYPDKIMWLDLFDLQMGADRISQGEVFNYRTVSEGSQKRGVQIAIARVFAELGTFANIVAANKSATAWNKILSSSGGSYDGMGTMQDREKEAYALQAAIVRYNRQAPEELFTPFYSANVFLGLLASGALSSVGYAHS